MAESFDAQTTERIIATIFCHLRFPLCLPALKHPTFTSSAICLPVRLHSPLHGRAGLPASWHRLGGSGGPGGHANVASTVRNRPGEHERKPAGEASASRHLLRVRLPFAVQVHAPFPPPLSPSTSITAPPPLGHSQLGRQRAAGTNRASSRVFFLSPRAAGRVDPPLASARRIARAVDPASPVSSLPSSASVGSVVVACAVVWYQGAWNGFGVEFRSFHALLSAEMGDT